MGSLPPPRDVVVADRGGIVENTHAVHVAVVDSAGTLLYTAGDPSRLTLSRSAAKPAQALAVLEIDGFDSFGFDQADLGLMCASHSSEDRHVRRARAMLAKVRATESDLRCGGHPSISPGVNRLWAKRDFEPTPVYNNCSGKHAGMLGGARALGADLGSYHLPDHPVQQRVKKVVQELSGLGEEDVEWATDGCNLPAPASPLHGMARLYASFAEAADRTERDVLEATAREQLQARIFEAMSGHSDMVGGEGRFCTALMSAFQGGLIGKVGADGFYGIGVRACEQTKVLGAEGGLGIAMKIEDGSLDILYAVVAEVLEQLQIGSTEMRKELASFHSRERVNTAGVTIGMLSYLFGLRLQA